MPEFLGKNARTPLVENLVAAGVPGRIATNSAAILKSAAETFSGAPDSFQTPRFFARLWVDPKAFDYGFKPKPYLRGWRNLVYASFGVGSFALIDLHSLTIVGRFSQELGADVSYWNRVIFPMLISVVSAPLGIAELHGACIARHGRGVLLLGPSRSGKSTLAMALATQGFEILSDDRTFCSMRQGRLMAWTPLSDVKLRADAMAWFPALAEQGAPTEEDGESSVRFDGQNLPNLVRVRECLPTTLIFLDHRESAALDLETMSAAETEARLRQELMAEPPEATRSQAATLSALLHLPAYSLRYNEHPLTVAKLIASCFDRVPHGSPHLGEEAGRDLARARFLTGASSGVTSNQAVRADRLYSSSTVVPATDLLADQIEPARLDPLYRFTPAPHVCVLTAMGKKIRFETNHSAVMQYVKDLFSVYRPTLNGPEQFHWRIIVQAGPESGLLDFERLAFSHEGLRFAQLGLRSFCAVDNDARVALAFVSEDLTSEKLFLTILDTVSFFCMSAATLGLVSLFANCVALHGKGVLILGPPGSGKTTASYLASKSGMHLHADGGMFLESHAAALRAWGGFWPIMFRSDAAKYFPELAHTAHCFRFREFSFYHLDKRSLQNSGPPAVTPIATIFLERNASAAPCLSPLPSRNVYRRVCDSILFGPHKSLANKQRAILKRISELPSYEFAYATDPGDALPLIHALLSGYAPRPEQQPDTGTSTKRQLFLP